MISSKSRTEFILIMHPEYKKCMPGYKINPDDGSINANRIDFTEMNFKELPFKFREVKGNFWCGNNPNLTSLEGGPQKIDFFRRAPEKVRGGFYCENNPKLSKKRNRKD